MFVIGMGQVLSWCLGFQEFLVFVSWLVMSWSWSKRGKKPRQDMALFQQKIGLHLYLAQRKEQFNPSKLSFPVMQCYAVGLL